MKKRILEYRERIDKLLEQEDENIDYDEVLKEHLTQIAFFQHERLIHLIVTVTFAIMTVMALGILLITGLIEVIGLIVLLLILLIPYVMHYYLLENETQKMYNQYDTLLTKIRQRGRQ
ncbi:MAG: hypothetical protein II838_07530 [Lachnospiraceae bacterium]|nr:hypothetical protein [Lachnospiraceae bacterium]MCR4803508.1 hypothetical protein [Lachnospiraceae bacterium]